MKLIKVTRNFIDLKLQRKVFESECYEVSDERATNLVKLKLVTISQNLNPKQDLNFPLKSPEEFNKVTKPKTKSKKRR